ncbi:TIGR02099 family protein [Simiduia sp. 21SJ11W-1]|uniref:YhdP family protein n=1 Tax=Simiduia sp. 21SJ11W-1 TaxID=2909669 RepID=UPI00209E014B|nr:YhdP family protein [Simiduia sp. 21SJ11W-1]UTA48810.1 TIGR02099 family protein [Simiduia sp. 21SJ11W-1]
MKPLATIFASLWRHFWQLAALLLILCALLVQLGRMAMPMVADYREPLARYLSSQLSLDVKIGALAGQWESLMPELALEGLSVSTPAGKPVLTVESALAEVDLLASLLQRRLRFSDMEFLGVRSNFVQSASGAIRLEGLQRANETPAATNYSLDDLRGLFLVGQKINLIDLQTHVTLQSGHTWAVVVNRVLLEHGQGRHRLSASLQLDERAEAVQIVMEGSGDPFEIDDFGSRAYVRVDGFPSERLLAMVARDFWQGLPAGEWRAGGKVSLEAWVDLTPGVGLAGVGSVALAGLPFEVADKQLGFQSLAGELAGHWHFDGSWQLQLQNAEVEWAGERHPPFAISAAMDVNKTLAVQADVVQLATWNRWLADSALVPEQLQQVLGALTPSGALTNVQLQWPQVAFDEFVLSANLQDVAVKAWQGAPALTGVNGYLRAMKHGGWLDLDSSNGFSMHYTSVYEQPMEYHTARGQVAWWLDSARESVFVNSGPVNFTGDDGKATGFVYIDAPMGREDKTLELLLQIGIKNSAAQYHKKYVPFVVSDTLRDWLKTAVGDGQVSQGGFMLHGFLSKDGGPEPNVQLWLDIQNARLDYQPPWPAVHEVDAELMLDNAHLVVAASQGRLHESSLPRARVTLAPGAEGELRLAIDADLAGPLSDVQRLLRESPLADITGDAFSNWRLVGDYQSSVKLDIPMGGAQSAPGFDVNAVLADASVEIGGLNLPLKKVTGSLRIADRLGVQTDNLRAELWGEPLNLNASLNNDTLRFVANTRADVQALLAWAGAAPLPQFRGVSPYRVQVHVPWRVNQPERSNAQVQLEISSPLTGLQVDLPAPFNKPATSRLPLVVQVPVGEDALEVSARLGDLLASSLSWQRRDDAMVFERGDVHFFGNSQLPKQPMLRVRGRLPEIDVAQWINAFEGQWAGLRDTQAIAQGTASSAPGPVDGTPVAQAVPIYVVINTPELIAKADHSLGESHIEAIKSSAAWRINLRNERIAGDLDLPYSADRPLDLSLNYLRLPLWENSDAAQNETEAAPSPEDARVVQENIARDAEAVWAAIAPLPDIRVAVASLYQQDENIGQVRFDASVRGATLTLGDIKGSLYGLQFAVDAETGRGAQLVWDHGRHESAFNGRLEAGDLGEVMSALAMEKLIESRSANFDMAVRWPGAPMQAQIVGLQGDVDFTIEQGRFLRADASAGNALMRLMGILNFDTWIRRLQLDFSDVYASGMAYDKVTGELAFDRGLLTLASPVAVRTPSSKMQMAGRVNLIENTLDTDLTVNLPVLDNLTFIAAVSAGLPVAAGVFVASRLFEKQFDQMTSVNYRVTGSLDSPEMKFMQISDARGRAPKSGAKPRVAPKAPAPDANGGTSVPEPQPTPNHSASDGGEATRQPQTSDPLPAVASDASP